MVDTQLFKEMAILKFNNVGLKAISACVPKNVVKTRSMTEYYSTEAIEKFIEATGIEERRIVMNNECASDLCEKAARQIFSETEVKPEDIDVLVFVCQTPDYKSPGTSIILQDKLGLKKDTIVYDANMSCSGFIHGMLMSYAFLQMPEINNVMVMVGDTLSKWTSPKDKSTGMLLGDAGIASVFTKGEQFGESYISIQTDGSNYESVMIKAGASRMPSSYETLEMKEYEDGSVRSLEQVIMNGSDVFSFAITELPKDIKRLLQYAGITIDDVDKYAFHQANNFMTNYIAKKSKANPDKILHSIQKYGNTAGTSIPLCMVENRTLIHENESFLMNAIGAGFTYGTVLLNIADCKILPLTEL